MIDTNTSLSDIIIQNKSGVDLAPTNLDLSGAEIELLNEIANNLILKEKLSPLS